VPRVLIKAQRVSNKKQTVILGLELFQIDYEEIVPYLSQKCAGSATLHESTSHLAKKDSHEIQVQGSHIDAISDILTKRYRIPQKYIDTVNTIESKKKKK
jgi:translation initiation factor 1 (eIF-1/SUI1)